MFALVVLLVSVTKKGDTIAKAIGSASREKGEVEIRHANVTNYSTIPPLFFN